MDDELWTVLDSETLLENPWFSVLSRKVRLPDNSEIDLNSVQFERPAVGVIARRRGQILLIRQYRLIVDRFVWAIPSGGVDAGESTEIAARRELLEETGLQATSLRPLVEYHPSYGSTNQVFQVFLAEDVERVTDSFDRNEVIEGKWFAQDEVLRMLLNNEIVDGLSATPLAMLFLEEALLGTAGSTPLRGEFHNG